MPEDEIDGNRAAYGHTFTFNAHASGNGPVGISISNCRFNSRNSSVVLKQLFVFKGYMFETTLLYLRVIGSKLYYYIEVERSLPGFSLGQKRLV